VPASIKATDFGTNRKPVCHFLLVNSTVTYIVSHIVSYRVILVNFLLSLTRSFTVNPWTHEHKIWCQKLVTSRYCKVQKYMYLNILNCDHACVSDRQTKQLLVMSQSSVVSVVRRLLTRNSWGYEIRERDVCQSVLRTTTQVSDKVGNSTPAPSKTPEPIVTYICMGD